MKKLFFSLISALGLVHITSNSALAAYISETGKTVLIETKNYYWNDFRPSFSYFSQVGEDRISGRVNRSFSVDANHYMTGPFIDKSSNGDVCEGRFSLTQKPGSEQIARWTVTHASKNERCRSVGQTFTTVVYREPVYTANGTGATLSDREGPMDRVNVRSSPSLDNPAHSYGLPGDRIWIQEHSDSWNKVRFQGSGTVGWVHHSRIIPDDIATRGPGGHVDDYCQRMPPSDGFFRVDFQRTIWPNGEPYAFSMARFIDGAAIFCLTRPDTGNGQLIAAELLQRQFIEEIEQEAQETSFLVTVRHGNGIQVPMTQYRLNLDNPMQPKLSKLRKWRDSR